MDLGDIIRVVIFLVVIYNLLFAKKQQQKPEQHEYPTFPEDKQQDLKQEEERMRKWLEDTFGGAQAKPQEQPLEQVQIYQEPEAIAQPQVICLPPKILPPATQRPKIQLNLMGKQQLANAVLMKEIFDKPRSKRPINPYR